MEHRVGKEPSYSHGATVLKRKRTTSCICRKKDGDTGVTVNEDKLLNGVSIINRNFL